MGGREATRRSVPQAGGAKKGAHETLRRIAAGVISPREVPENAALLERRESEMLPAVAAVFHLSAIQPGTSTAA